MQANYARQACLVVFFRDLKRWIYPCVTASLNATKHIKKLVEISQRVLYDLFDY